jgi:hypothetical protein
MELVKSLKALLVVGTDGADEVGEDIFEDGLDQAFDFGLNLVEHVIEVALVGEVALLLLALAAYFVEGSLDTTQPVNAELSCFWIDGALEQASRTLVSVLLSFLVDLSSQELFNLAQYMRVLQ